MNCATCPCPAICLRWALFCEWAVSGTATQKAHICGRSALRPDLVPRSGVADTLRILLQAKRCPYRGNRPPCGCAGARCALRIDPMGPEDPPRRGAVVSHQDCVNCIARYGLG